MAQPDPFQTPTASTAATQQASTQQATSQGYQAQTYDPTKADGGTASATYRTVQPNELVQNQLKGLIDDNSPLLQQARSRAADMSNSRGLINSTMGAQAGMAAMYDYALPIAQQDATSFGTAARDNQGVANSTSQFNAGLISGAARDNAAAQNQASEFTAGAANNTSQFNANQSNQQSQFNATQSNQQSQFNSDQQNKMILSTLDANIRQNLMGLEAQYKNEMQTSQTAAEIYKQSLSAIQAIQNNPEFDANTKQQLIQNQYQLLQQGMQVAGATSRLNLGSIIDLQASTGVEQQVQAAPQPTSGDPISQRFGPQQSRLPVGYSGGLDAFGNPTYDYGGG